MLFKKEYHKNQTKQVIAKLHKHSGLNDLLGYLVQLDDSTILHKDGAISRHFKYIAPDVESATDNELDYHAETWRNSLQFLGDGWMVEANVISQTFTNYNKPQEFPELVSGLIDDERRMQFQGGYYLQTTYYLSITWKPTQLIASKLRQFAIDNHDKQQDGFTEQLQSFNQKISEYIGYLKRSLININPLSDNELTSFLHQCITGYHHKLAKPDVGSFLDCYLASEDFVGGFEPEIGKHYIKVLAIDDLPAYSYPCILDALNYFPIEYRWSNRFIALDKTTAKTYLKRYERSWSSKAIGVMGVLRESLNMPSKLDQDAQNTVEQLKDAQTENSAGNVGYGFYNSNIILMHSDKEYLNKITEEIVASIQQLEFKVRVENVNAVEGYLGSIPCHGDYNLRKMMVDTYYISHAFSTSSVYQGETKAPCQLAGYKKAPPLLLTATRGSRPFCLNLHVGDVGHTAVLGPTGNGKTTLMAAIMVSHRKYQDSRIIVLDKDYSNRIMIKALNGAYYDLAKNDCQFNIFSRLDSNNAEQIDKAVNWLMDCCQVQGVAITPAKQKLLREAVLRLASEDPPYKNLNHLSLQDPTLREAIAVFNTGRFQQLLNGTGNQLTHSNVMGFEMNSLIKVNHQERDLNIPVIKAIFNELEELFKDRQPTLLVLEEAWLYLRHPLFFEKLTDWFKTLRKYNVSVVFISQDVADIVNSGAASVIQGSCMTRIFIPNASANENAVSEHYKAFGLNERQLEILRQATPKQDYYYQSRLGNRLFNLDLGELAKAFMCVSDKVDMKQFDEVYRRGEPSWVIDWLQYKDLSEWSEFIKKNYR